jgi:hypothetical protein
MSIHDLTDNEQTWKDHKNGKIVIRNGKLRPKNDLSLKETVRQNGCVVSPIDGSKHTSEREYRDHVERTGHVFKD